MTTVPPCLECGVCCFSELPTYVRVSGDDHERLGERAESLVHFVENKAYMRMKDGHCAALVVDVATAQFVCSVYETRPETCRDLARASGACFGEIESKGERPFVALKRLTRT